MARSDSSVIEAKDVCLSYKVAGGELFPVLNNVTLNVKPGEWVSIVGPSGSGKSSLLYCLSGLVRPTAGDVVVNGKNISSMSNTKLASLRRKEIGFIFQSYNLIPSLTAGENVQLTGRLAGRGDQWREALDSVGLSDKAASLPDQLSGGQRQRVGIARALVSKPSVLFADEPTGALDSRTGREVLERLETVIGYGGSVVMVTHDLAAACHADRAIVLRDGKVAFEMGDPAEEILFEAIRELNAQEV